MTATEARMTAVAQFDAEVRGTSSVDRHEMFARCRSDAPVFFSDALGAWVLSRYGDVRAVLEDETRFRSLVDEPGASLQRSFLQMTGREHNKKAGTVARRIRAPRAFTEGLEEAIRDISRRQAEQLPMGEPVDVKRDYAMWIPLLAITELTDVQEAGRFRDWYQRIASGGVASLANPADRSSGLEAVEEVREFLKPIIAERRGSDATDLVSTLAASTYDGELLSDEEIVSTVTFLLTAGVETTERALASLLRHLLLNPDQWSALAAAHEDRSYVAGLSAETVRYFPPVQLLTRRSNEAVVFHGSEIPDGDRLVLLLASANRDEDEFDDAERFDPGRFGDRGDQQFQTASRIMPFGAGRHHCTGSRLAASEMVNAMTEFCRRVARIEPAGEPPPAEGFMLRSPPAVPMILHAA
jgi:cytochrome P450